MQGVTFEKVSPEKDLGPSSCSPKAIKSPSLLKT